MHTTLSKYWRVFSITWQNGLVYPISVLFWRARQFLSTFMSLTIWTVVFANQANNFGYTQSEMTTYIFLVGFLQSIVLATILGSLADDIYTGKMSYNLLKPMSTYAYLAAQDIADKLKNFLFIIVETSILFWLFHPSIVFPPLPQFLIFLLATVLGAVLLFIIMLLFGTIGFWSSDTWGARFLFYMFMDFTAGKLFPLNILPKIFQQILAFTPFPYLSYVQTQLFLQKETGVAAGQTILVLVIWIVLLGFIFHRLWHKGLKEYGAMGH